MGCIGMQKEGPTVSEPEFICDVCGKKKPDSQMVGKCVKCGKYVCSECAKLKGDKVYCPKCAGHCFIATVSYGTAMAREIDTLREFRDAKLESSVPGKSLVRFYYTISPPLANIIARSEGMKRLVRLNLNPIIYALKSQQRKKDPQS
jgi:hypothetical protein